MQDRPNENTPLGGAGSYAKRTTVKACLPKHGPQSGFAGRKAQRPPRGAAQYAKRQAWGPYYWPRWYLLTARLCSSRLALNWLVPSPLATK